MTAPNLIAIVGAGSALTLAGFALMGGAAGAALAYYFPQIHISIWLLIIGGIMLVLGLALVERGGAKTVQKVENELSMPNVMSNFPWTFVGLGAGATLFTVWLLRRRSPTETIRTEIKPVYVPAPPPAMQSFTPPSPPKRTTLSDVLMPLGSAAASYATTIGMKALGIPSPSELLGFLVHRFMGSDDKPAPVRPTVEKSHNGYEQAMRRT
jgi:hypothetical protein